MYHHLYFGKNYDMNLVNTFVIITLFSLRQRKIIWNNSISNQWNDFLYNNLRVSWIAPIRYIGSFYECVKRYPYMYKIFIYNWVLSSFGHCLQKSIWYHSFLSNSKVIRLENLCLALSKIYFRQKVCGCSIKKPQRQLRSPPLCVF